MHPYALPAIRAGSFMLVTLPVHSAVSSSPIAILAQIHLSAHHALLVASSSMQVTLLA
jgi:hypothetical protein